MTGKDKTVSIGSNEIALRYRSIFIFRMFMFILLEVALLFFPESTLRAIDLSLLLFSDFLLLRWGGGGLVGGGLRLVFNLLC